jgi:hypothetical protein
VCCRYTTTPKCWSGVCVSTGLASWSCSSCSVVALGVELSATRLSAGRGQTGPRLPLTNIVVRQVGMAGLEPASPCSQSTWVRRYPTSRHPVRTGGFEPPVSWSPTRRDIQASLRSAASSSCGSRTRLSALKGQYPPTDRRTSHHGRAPSTQWTQRVSAHLSRSGSGGARIRVCGSSGRRYTISATDPNEKSLMSL